ncbi:MAG: translocation/assembly module TamB domain-containing protein [Moraxella sp.]|nr:translocation/assembly module TamB domain-containing protein [Moraxella sp.]
MTDDLAILSDNTPTDKVGAGALSPKNQSSSQQSSNNANHSDNTNNSNNTNSPNSNPNPNKKPRRAFGFFGRLLFWVLVVFAVLFVILYTALGTQTGTQFILQKIVTKTGVQLEYSEGNLRDGLWVQNIHITQVPDMGIYVDKAYVQLGWRGLLAQQVHLASAKIDTITITNHKPPTDDPFGYDPISTPITLKLDNASVKSIVYQQVGNETIDKKTVNIDNASVKSATWTKQTISVTDGKVVIRDIISVYDVQGKITFNGEYPLNATATVAVHDFEKLYIEPMTVQATGTLKRTVGKVFGRYNGSPVQGDVVVQGLDTDTPFWARLESEQVVLPYADSQQIVLQNSVVTASGIPSAIELRVNTELDGRDIPKGQYQGQATVRFDGMDVHSLRAMTDGGQLSATGQMSWDKAFTFAAVIQGDGTQVAPLIPKEYAAYTAYAPDSLRGTLGVKLGLDDGQNNTWYEFDLAQQDGESVWVRLAQSNHTSRSPWHIDANWQSLVRTALPSIGKLDSPSGTAKLIVDNGAVDIDVQANIKALSSAPVGDYQFNGRFDGRIDGDVITVHKLDYAGVVGDLTAKGEIGLAHQDKPLTWQFEITTPRLLPNSYLNADSPLKYLSGTAHATGLMREEGKQLQHKIDIHASDLTAGLDDKGVQQVGISGAGALQLSMAGSDVLALALTYDGRLKTVGINDGLSDNALGLAVRGNLKQLSIDKLTLQGELGNLSAAGELGLANGVQWHANVHMDALNTQKFTPQSPVVLTGDVVSKGAYRNGVISQSTAKFDGQMVQGDSASVGNLLADVAVDGNTMTVHELNYTGKAGVLTADGTLDISRGYVGQINAKMTGFDLGAFVKKYTSHLTGVVSARVNWQSGEQAIHIDDLDVTGVLNNENFVAKGVLSAVLDLPDNLGTYIRNMRHETYRQLNINTLTQDTLAERISRLQNAIGTQYQKQQQLIKQLDAQDVVLVLGDNRLGLDGDISHLSLDINAQTLSQIIPTLRGAVAGGMIIVQDDNILPTFYVDIKVQGIGIGNFAIREGAMIGKVVNLGNDDSQLLITATQVIAAGKSLNGLRFDFNGTQAKHHTALMISNYDMEVRAKFEGSLSDNDYQGVLSEGRLQTSVGVLNQRQPAQIAYDMASGRMEVAAHCWQTVTSSASTMGSLCLQDTLSISPKTGDVDIVVQNLDTSVFTPILPSDLSWNSRLNGKVAARWGQGDPVVNAVLYSDNGTVGLRAKDTDDVVLPYRRVSVIAETVPTGLKLRTDINTGQGGNGYVDVIVNPYQDNKPITGALVLNEMHLDIFRPFFPAIQTMSGLVNVAGGLGGTLSQPLFYGSASLSNGRFALVDVPISLNEIALTASMAGTHATLEGGFKSGTGVGKLTGDIDWQSELQAKFGVSGENLVISSPPLLSASITPYLEIITRPLQKYVDIKGVVSVPEATIRPPETSNTIINESTDVYVIDRRMTGNVSNILAQVEPWSINADIGLDLGDDVVFRGFGARLPLAGALHLTQSGQGSLQGRGVIQVSKRTTVDVIGQNLDLNYAQIRFNGNVQNPRLSIEAAREIDSSTVGVRVTGVLANPNISVFNDAGLSEQQAMNALVTGSLNNSGSTQISEQGLKTQVTNNLAAAGLSFGLQGTRGITNQLGRALGLQSLVVDASGGTDDASVNVTGYITPDLYIRYGVGVFNAESSLSMRYQLTQRVYIEATSATENFIDMIYRWRF